MNDAHYHLLLNHMPILGALFGVLLLGSGFITKSVSVLKAGMTTILVVSVLTMPAYFTGEAAEKVVEDLPGVRHDDIAAHEEAGELGLWVMAAAGSAALMGLLTTSSNHRRSARYKKPRTWAVITLLVSVAAFGIMAWAGVTGGLIRHSELHENPPAAVNAVPK
ncbi:hypothetical protein GU926_14860 [Nibribacter ruber]|uniref:DUF2231 domain-containing protein n=1 Tax=Nibribacter ruber TaxID=2698458 RepID=A0A6P1P2K3_9BACT|nr:hypothetical protein [Nibribacter ruber]QHL88639.1 hypothetical protein GU926_14860 [Nibribacter ruber]